MEARVIKDYDPANHNITEDLLYNTNDWDLVELNYNIDSLNDVVNSVINESHEETINNIFRIILKIERYKKIIYYIFIR